MESAQEPPSMDLHTHTCSSQFSNSPAVPLASQHPPSLGKTLSYGHIVCSGIPASFLHLSHQCLRANPGSHSSHNHTGLASNSCTPTSGVCSHKNKHAHPHLNLNPHLKSWDFHICISCRTFTEHCTQPHPERSLPHLIACREQTTITSPHPNT